MTVSRPMFIGCATDRRFVEPTAVMLTSLEINGCIPEAGIVVAGFDLNDHDRGVLRIGAGRMAANLRFLNVTREMLHEVDPDGFTDEYPPSVLGRLFVAASIDVPGARLLTLDSDMIVNVSLRPLFNLDLGHEYFAAIHDPPRKDDPNYFNSGLTLCDVERYQYFDVARRCIKYINQYHPHFPDQDALNSVVGDSWYRLHRLWNYFYSGDRPFSLEDYEVAKVAHFCGWKPWDHDHHPANPLYSRYLSIYRARLARSALSLDGCGNDFIASCYELFLARDVEHPSILHERSRQSRPEVLRNILLCDEFTEGTLPAVLARKPLRSQTSTSMRQRLWAADQLPVTHQTGLELLNQTSRADMIRAILSDSFFVSRCGLSYLKES